MSIITEALKKAQDKRLKKDDPSEVLLKYPLPSTMPGRAKTSATEPKIKQALFIGINKPIGAAIILLLVIVFGSLTGVLLYKMGSHSSLGTKNSSSQNNARPGFYQKKNSSSKNTNTELISIKGRTLPVLSGVMYSPVNPQAIVNGKVVSEGDKMGGFKLIKIYPTSVKVSSGEEEFELKLR